MNQQLQGNANTRNQPNPYQEQQYQNQSLGNPEQQQFQQQYQQNNFEQVHYDLTLQNGYSNQAQMQNGYPNQVTMQNGYPNQVTTQNGYPNTYMYQRPQIADPNWARFNMYPQPMQNNYDKNRYQQLQKDIKEKESQIENLELEIDQIKNQKLRETRQLKLANDELQSKLDYQEAESQQQIERYNKKITELTEQFQQMKRKLELQNQSLQSELNEKDEEIQNLKNTNSQLQQQYLSINSQQPDRNAIQSIIQEQNQQEKLQLQRKIAEYKKQIENDQKQKNEEIDQKQQKIDELQHQIEKEHEYLLEEKDKLASEKKRYLQLEKQIKEKDESINNLTAQSKGYKEQIKHLNDSLKFANENINQQKQQIEQIDNLYRSYIKNLQNNRSDTQIIKQFEENLRQLQNGFQETQRKNQEEAEKILKQKELEYEQNKKKLKLQEQQKQQMKQQENKHIKELMKKKTKDSFEEFGKLDICYVIDFTKSMEPYVEQARNCVQESLKVIKFQTNRDTIVSSIAYYDKEQKPIEGYHQFNFSQNIQEFEKFMLGVPIVGGRDPPEDVKGALQQMIQNLEWKNKFKIAILITDSPCHGNQYHNCKMDYHPDDDLTLVLKKLIQQQIILIGFNLNQGTMKMYEEIKKVYESEKVPDLFLYVDVTGLTIENLAQKMANSLGSASVNATQVKSSGTKTKKQQQERPKNKDGAMEALCKQGDFYNFETKTQTVETEFTVLNVTLNEEIFNKNLITINQIGRDIKKDYVIKEEGLWKCIRTTLPFAFGMMKDVFLMKKNQKGSDELYVIKTPLGSEPYKSQEEAIQECRSHLICQQLMKKFNYDIQEEKEAQEKEILKFPKVVYSDFLILKENETKYWIAERFFKGEFVKYNNNYGFINDEQTDLNRFAQAFSYYTYFISQGNYMINDVQGVGNYFTDPAINTTAGNFDDTDLGQDGIQMYLVNFESKKDIPSKILELLNILNEQ